MPNHPARSLFSFLRNAFASAFATFIAIATLTHAAAQAPASGVDPHDLGEDQFWNLHYVRNLGLFLGHQSTFREFSDLNAESGGNPILDWSGPVPGFLINVQLQEDFDSSVRDPLPATFSWARDLKTGVDTTDYTIDAALVANLYFPSNRFPIFGFDQQGAAHHFRVGVDIDRNDTSDGREDILKYRAESQFLLGQKLFGVDRDMEREPDIWRIGVEYRQDRMTDTGGWAFDLSYIPVLKLLPFRAPGKDKGLFLGRRSYWKDGDFAKWSSISEREESYAKDGELDPQKADSTFINLTPIITFETADTESLADRGFDDQTHFVKAELVNSLGLLNERLKLQYAAVGMAPLNGESDTFFHQRVSLVVKPDPRGPLSVNLNYVNGEGSPTFVDEEMISLSLGTTF